MSHIQDLSREISWNVLILLFLSLGSLLNLLVSAIIGINREITCTTNVRPDRLVVHVVGVYVAYAP